MGEVIPFGTQPKPGEVIGPVSVYGSVEHRFRASADHVALAVIAEAWAFLAHTTGIGPSQDDHLQAALELLRAAEPIIRERLGGGEAA